MSTSQSESDDSNNKEKYVKKSKLKQSRASSMASDAIEEVDTLSVEDEIIEISSTVSRSEVVGRFYNPNTTPKDKEWVVVCLCGTGQELHWKGYYTKGIDAAKEQRFLWLAEVKKDN